MKEYIEERAIKMAEYIIENKTTVRQTAKEFGISKSTVHKDGNQREILTYEIEPESACCGVRQADFWYGDVGLRATGEKLG